jgi:glycosyltransferase involved in cell wall biosynthesis
MKVALVNTADLGGGAERSVLALHCGLRSRGIESTLYVGRKHTTTDGVIEIPYRRGIPGSRRLARIVEANTGWQDIYNPSFRNLKKLIDPETEIVHFHNIWGGSGGGYADIGVLPSLTRKFPGVLTEHQTWFFTGHCAYFRDCQRWQTGCGRCPDLTIPPAITKDGTRFNWKRKLRVVQKSDLAFIGISNWVTSLAEQSPIWAGKEKHTIYEGIDTETFRPVSLQEKQRLRASLGIPNDRVAIL